MKKSIRLLSIFLIVLTLTLTACKGGEEAPATASTTSQTDGESVVEALTLVKDGVAQYYIVFGGEFVRTSEYIEKTVQQKTGVKMKSVKFENKDWTEHKIYIGNNYDDMFSDAEEKLTYDGYAVLIVQDDIYIFGRSDETTKAAAEKFLTSVSPDNITSSEDGKKTMIIPKSLAFVYNPDYAVSDPTLLSTHVSEYQIVYGKDEYTAQIFAQELKDYIGKWTGFDILAVPDSVSECENEILIGKTNRVQYVEAAIDEYSFKAVGSKIQIGGSYISLFECISDFRTMFGAEGIDFTKKITSKTAVLKGEDEIRVMSSNVGIPNGEYIELTDVQRAKILGECYLMLKPDFVGLQEAVDTLSYITEEISEVYGVVSQSGEGTLGVRCPILYLKDEWKVAVSGQVEIKGWHKFSILHCYEWVMFERIDDSSERFIMINLHYPTASPENMNSARTPAAQATNEKIRELMSLYPDVPIAVTGDYNSQRDSNEDIFPYMYKGIEEKLDIAQRFTEDRMSGKTRHEMGISAIGSGTAIDYVSVTNELVTVVRHRTVSYGALGLSGDHFPIFIDVKIKNAS